MLKIVVTSPDIREMKGTAKVSGRPYHMRIQTAHAFTVHPETGVVAEFPDKFEIALEEGQAPYQRGSYVLSPSALFVSREGKLDVRPRLAPAPAAPKA